MGGFSKTPARLGRKHILSAWKREQRARVRARRLQAIGPDRPAGDATSRRPLVSNSHAAIVPAARDSRRAPSRPAWRSGALRAARSGRLLRGVRMEVLVTWLMVAAAAGALAFLVGSGSGCEGEAPRVRRRARSSAGARGKRAPQLSPRVPIRAATTKSGARVSRKASPPRLSSAGGRALKGRRRDAI